MTNTLQYRMTGINSNDPTYPKVVWLAPVGAPPDFTGQYCTACNPAFLINIQIDGQPISISSPIQYNNPSGPAQGDLSGMYPNPQVIGLGGFPISGSEIDGYTLVFKDGYWVISPSTAVFTAAGDLTGSAASQTVVGLYGNAVYSQALTGAFDGYVLTWDGYWAAKPNDAAVSFGGDLESISPTEQEIVSLQGNSLILNTLHSNSDGYVMQWTGTNLAVLPLSLQSGDAQTVNSLSSKTIVKGLQGVPLSATAPTSNDILSYSSTFSEWLPTSGNLSLSGDLFCAGSVGSLGIVATGVKITGLQGNAIQASTLGSGQQGYVLTWENAASQWQAQPSVASTLMGDLSGTTPNITVVGIDGYAIATPLLLTSATDGYVLTYTNSSGKLSFKPAPSGSFTAGGDLTGSSSSQTIYSIDGYQIVGGNSATPGTALVLNTSNQYVPTGVRSVYNALEYGCHSTTTSGGSGFDNAPGLQLLVNACLSSSYLSGSKAIAYIPGVQGASQYYVIRSPIFITGSGLTIEGDQSNNKNNEPSSLLIKEGFIGDAFYVYPTGVASPQTTAVWLGDGYVYMNNFRYNTGNGQNTIYLSEYCTGNINGLSTYTAEFFFTLTALPNDYCALIFSGGTDGYNSSQALTLFFTNSGTGNLYCALETSTGNYAFTTANNADGYLTADGYNHCAVVYDGSSTNKLYLWINGNLAGSIAATGTIVQNSWEDFTIGLGAGFAGSSLYPFGGGIIGQPAQMTGMGNFTFSNNAKYTSPFAMPQTGIAGFTGGLNTLLQINFDPTYVAQAGVVVGYSWNSANGSYGPINPALPVYYSWCNLAGPNVSYATNITIKNIGVVSNTTGYSSGVVRATCASDMTIDSCYFSGTGRGFTLVNNCYNSIVRNCFCNVLKYPGVQTWALCMTGAANQNAVYDSTFYGGAYTCVIGGGSGLLQNVYINPVDPSGTITGLLVNQEFGQMMLSATTISDEQGTFSTSGITINGVSSGLNNSSLLLVGSDINGFYGIIANDITAVELQSSNITQAANTQLYSFVVQGGLAGGLIMSNWGGSGYGGQALSFGGSVPAFSILSRNIQQHNIALTTTYNMTVDDFSYGIINFTGTAGGTIVINLPPTVVNVSGFRKCFVNSSNSVVKFEWIGGSGSTGITLTPNYSADFRADGTNLQQITPAFNF